MLNQGVVWLAEGYRPGGVVPPEGESLPESEDRMYISAYDLDKCLNGESVPSRQRPYSAQERRTCERETRPSRPRPSSARPPSAGKRRVYSAGYTRSNSYVNLSTSYYIPTDPRSKVKINFHPDPTHWYMDRHSRCFDTSHIHNPLLAYRPQPACRSAWTPRSGSRPNSSCSARAAHRDHMSKTQRYTDSHRPQTAPGTRKELQVLTKSNFIIRGLKPHFCNFVHEAHLHERDLSDRGHGWASKDGDEQGDRHGRDDGRDDFSLSKHWRRGSGMSGMEGPPCSPSSLDDGGEPDSSQVTQPSWDKSYKSKHKTGPKTKKKSNDNKENDLKSFIQIPPSGPQKEPKPAWTETVKKSGKSGSSGKKGSVTAAVKSSGDLEVADESKVSRKRSCIRKKEKKAMNAHRRDTNQDMEQQMEPVTTVVEEKKTPEPEKVESEQYHVDVKVPDLPTPQKEDKERGPKNERQRRHQLEVDFLKSDAHEPLTQEMRDHHLDFDFDVDIMSDDTLSKNKVRMSSWLSGRLALSQQSSRFTLPMDMKILEKMSPQEYLRTYCVISSRRHILYQKIFSKNRERGSGLIVFKDIEKALKDVLVNTITSEEVSDISQLLEIDEETNIDYQLFCGIAAFAERILYPKFVTSDTAELADFQRDKIECADFCALDWKFHGVNVNPPVRKVLKSLG